MTTDMSTELTAGIPVAPIVHLDVEERLARGRAARKNAARREHARWDPPGDRSDPVALIAGQELSRLPELLPLRHERMLASPFAFYRGAAVIMAGDLATQPSTGLRVQACGDAHLANFGGYLAPDRRIVFDMNDFDETSPAPFEWDVKRLATSFELAARDVGLGRKASREVVTRSVRAYRTAMREFAGMRNLDLWYARLDVEGVLARWQDQVSKEVRERFARNVAKAEAKNSLRAFDRLTEYVDGKHRIASDPPLLVPIRELDDDPDAFLTWLQDRIRVYRNTLQADRRHLLEEFRTLDAARKVVGVGSVGTRCWIILLVGRDGDDPLFLQVKEANESVLEPHAGRSAYANHGQRVVEGQRLLQSASDILLGWIHARSLDGVERDFYVRQLWDGKLSPDFATMAVDQLTVFAELCGWTLARGHARSGDRIAIAAYLGASDQFDQAIADFAVAYAEQNQRDYDAVAAAVKAGRLAGEVPGTTG